MAALTHFGKVDGSVRTTTSTTAVEVTEYTVAWADLTGAGFSAGDDVLLLCQTSLGGSSVTVVTHWNILAGTTFAGAVLITDAHVEQEPVATSAPATHNAFWIERHTLVVNENFYFSLHNSAAATARSDDFSFIVLRLNDLTENVDFKWNRVAHGAVDAPTSYDTTGASVTIPSASQDWLALAQVRWLDDSTSADMFTALNVDGTDRMELRNEGENVAGDYLIGIIDALVSPANGATVQVRFKTDTSTTHDAFTSKVFILRLGVFENYGLARSTSTITHSVLDTMQEFAGFGTFALTTTGDVGFFAQSRHVFNEATKGPYGQLQDGNVDIVSGYRRSTAMGNGAVDQVSVTFAVIAARTAGTLDIDFDIAEDFDVTGSYTATEHSAVVFSFQKNVSAATVTPAVIAVTVSLPTPTILVPAQVAPAVIPVTVSLPTPTILISAVVTPAVIPVVVALPTPTVTAEAIVTPAVIPVTVSLPTPITVVAAVVNPAVIAVTVALPTPTVLAAAKVLPAVILVTLELPTPTVIGGAIGVVTPDTIAVTISLLTPAISVDAIVTPAGIAVIATLPTPIVSSPGLATPAGISVVVTLPTPLATVGAITFWTPNPVLYDPIGAGDQPPWN